MESSPIDGPAGLLRIECRACKLLEMKIDDIQVLTAPVKITGLLFVSAVRGCAMRFQKLTLSMKE